MQLLADYFPLILFFVAFKWQGIYVATAVAIAASVLQIAWFAWRGLVQHGYRPLARDGEITVLERRGGRPPQAPVAPAYDEVASEITIPTTTGVEYKINGATKNPGEVVPIEVDTIVTAAPAMGYRFTGVFVTSWLFEV